MRGQTDFYLSYVHHPIRTISHLLVQKGKQDYVIDLLNLRLALSQVIQFSLN